MNATVQYLYSITLTVLGVISVDAYNELYACTVGVDVVYMYTTVVGASQLGRPHMTYSIVRQTFLPIGFKKWQQNSVVFNGIQLNA